MRTFFPQADKRLQAVLEPRRFIRWLYVGRLSIAFAILIAALTTWFQVNPERTLVATVSFVGALVFTAASFVWTEVNQWPLTEGFFYGQLVVDLLVVTSIVHVTSSPEAGSQFAALYILVNAAAALLLPIGGALLIALLGSVMYVTDALFVTGVSPATLFQLVVFVAAAVTTAYISARMQEAGKGREMLAAELTTVRLREKDILANIRSGILSVDASGGLLFANPSASELLGVNLDARIGRPVLDELRAVAPVLGEALDRAARDRVPSLRTEGLVTRGGRAFPLGVTTTSSEGDGRHVGRTTTAIFQDISDQKRLEQLNLRTQRLEAVAELSASLAHEIKNPLASIRSAVEQMSGRPAASDDEKTLGDLIVRESDRLARLLSEFLDFARVRVTRREAVDFGAVVRGAAGLAGQHPARTESVALDLDVPAAPLLVHGDEDLLHRAVFNLVLNALQAARPGTRVRLIAGAATGDELPREVPFDGRAVSLQVIDEGPGIPRDVQDRLFEPFTTTKEGGSGLGLAVAHRAIEAHRGVVLVDTNERGTRFTVLLPHADTAGVPS
ncbi:MAG TPA: ATP-binding protein [Gemmatimonadaceae bacterium]|nr:ATP-binding protein [Gemmatimonadaceae bacterium]